MFHQGLFFYGPAGPKGGATSPLWAFLLGLCYLWPAGAVHLAKALSLALYVTDGALIAAISYYWFRSPLGALVAGACWLLDSGGLGNAALLYETSLAAGTVILALHLTAVLWRGEAGRRLLLAWALTLGALPLVRPEATLVAVLCFLAVAVRWRPRSAGALVALALLSIACGAAYYGPLSLRVGAGALSSARGRLLLAATMGAHTSPAARLAASLQVLWNDPATRALLVAAALILPWLPRVERRRRGLCALLIGVAILYSLPVLLASTEGYGYTIRYLLPIYPCLAVLAGAALGPALEALPFRTPLVPSLAVLLAILAAGPGTLAAARTLRAGTYSLDAVMDRDVATSINRLARPGQRVLVYEIQSQYLMRPEAVSLDGIVGGEVLGALRRPAAMPAFLGRYDYVVTSAAFAYRPELARTVLGSLYAADAALPVGASWCVRSGRDRCAVRLTKVWQQRPSRLSGLPTGAGHAIYRITPAPGDGPARPAVPGWRRAWGR